MKAIKAAIIKKGPKVSIKIEKTHMIKPTKMDHVKMVKDWLSKEKDNELFKKSY